MTGSCVPSVVYAAWFDYGGKLEVVAFDVMKTGPKTLKLKRRTEYGAGALQYRSQVPRKDVSVTPREALERLLAITHVDLEFARSRVSALENSSSQIYAAIRDIEAAR